MKKGLKLFACGFLAITAMATHVNAEEVTDASSLAACVAKTENTCTLKNNVEVASAIEVGTNIVLDLNGYTLSANEESFADDSLLVVLRKGTLTVQDSSTAKAGKIDGENDNLATTIKVTKYGENDDTDAATLVVNSGTITGKNLAISGNGNRHNTVITINDGVVSSTNSTAIYHPQDGTITVNGGTIEGATGIEMRSGKLTVTGGTIRGTYQPVEVNANGSGTTTDGAGIAVAQHTTKKAIEVKVSGGTIEGHTALYESNPQKNEAAAIEKVSITVSGGTLNTINGGTNAIYSENDRITVEGGEFNAELPEDVTTSEGSEVYEVETEDGETKYVVATDEEVVEEVYETEVLTKEEVEANLKEIEELLKEVAKEELEEEAQAYYELLENFLADVNEALKGKTIASSHDIFYGSFIDGNYVLESDQRELNEAVEVTISIPESLEKVKEGYTRKYTVIRTHETIAEDGTLGYEIAELDAKDNGDGTVTFASDKFSTYILAYEDVQNTTNPNTGDNILVYLVLSVISVAGLMFTGLKVAKKNN